MQTASNPTKLASSKPHKSTITSLRFFPSSRVLLSSGLDFSLCILPADPSAPSSQPVTPARTLMGHTRTVTSTAIIPPGRNVLSASLDGTVRLWDVSAGTTLRTMPVGTGVTALSLSLAASASGEEQQALACALQNGTFTVLDLRSPSPSVAAHGAGGSRLNTIAYSADAHLLATGSANGIARVYDARSLGAPLTSFSRNTASIEDLAFFGGDGYGLAIGTEDGLPFLARLSSGSAEAGVEVSAELAGGEVDAVRHVRARDGGVWTAADDGLVRRYEV